MRGHTGIFAGAAARQRRAQAVRVAEAVGAAVRRVGQAEAAAVAGYREGVEAWAAAEATGVPWLSAEAKLAVRLAPDPAARTAAWRAVRADGEVAGKVAGFLRAVERRLGAEGLRALDRSGTYAEARLESAEREALTEAGRMVQAAREGMRADSGER